MKREREGGRREGGRDEERKGEREKEGGVAHWKAIKQCNN